MSDVGQRIVLALVLPLVAALACEEPRVCPAVLRGDKLIVTVRDGQTKASICDARVFVGRSKSPERTELVVGESCAYEGGGDFEDTFTVDVSHPSYRSARREGIRARTVDVDGCSERIANVDIELEH
jgi:hypothetical protein